MTGKNTSTMLENYKADAPVTLFLSSLFIAKPKNFYTSEFIEIDIERDDEDIAITISEMNQSGRLNKSTEFTNKRFKAPVYKEKFVLNAFETINRVAGEDPFKSISFQASATSEAFTNMQRIEKKIHRSLELQAANILTTGIVSLPGQDTGISYSLDFKPKATHFPTVGTAWTGGAGDPLDDISSLADVIRTDGKQDPDQLIFGKKSFANFMENADVIQLLETRRADQGQVARQTVNAQGGIKKGSIDIDQYSYDMWAYSGQYKHPQTGTATFYIPDEKVIVRSSTGRMDKTFGAIPSFLKDSQRALPAIPRRLSNRDSGMDLHTSSWIENDGESLTGQAGARPLCIPVAIDTYGALDTQS